jgi:hypothetical protein
MAAALGHLIQAECAVMDQRHLPRRRYMPPRLAPQPRASGSEGAIWAGSAHRRACASQAGDAVDTRGLERFRERHRRQEGGAATGQPRLPRPWRTEEEEVWGTAPASRSASLIRPRLHDVNPLVRRELQGTLHERVRLRSLPCSCCRMTCRTSSRRAGRIVLLLCREHLTGEGQRRVVGCTSGMVTALGCSRRPRRPWSVAPHQVQRRARVARHAGASSRPA